MQNEILVNIRVNYALNIHQSHKHEGYLSERLRLYCFSRNLYIDQYFKSDRLLCMVVWALAVSTIVAWYKERKSLFHILTVATLFVWLVAYLAFLYGLHVYPMT